MFNSTTIKDYLTADNLPYVDNEEMSTRFWEAVDRKLKEARMSRAELARRAKLSNQSLTSAKYLKSNLTIFTVLRLTKALGCTIEDLIYDKSDAVTRRDAEYTSLFEEGKEESDTCEISTLAELFNELKSDEKLAVLVHVFSLIGLTVKKTIKRIDEESIEGAN